MKLAVPDSGNAKNIIPKLVIARFTNREFAVPSWYLHFLKFEYNKKELIRTPAKPKTKEIFSKKSN